MNHKDTLLGVFDSRVYAGDVAYCLPDMPDCNPCPICLTRRTGSILSYEVTVRTLDPMGEWHYMVDASAGEFLAAWDDMPAAHPSEVWDAQPDPDELWFVNHVQVINGTPPLDVTNLNQFGGEYDDYLSKVLGINSIDNLGMPLIGHARFAFAGLNARWTGTGARFSPGLATRDIVAQEYTHGLVQEMGGRLVYQGQSGALNEAIADTFAEYLECQTACDWTIGEGSAIGVVRNMANPPALGDPDHMDDFLVTTGDFGGVHTNSGIPNKVAHLLKAGGTHYGRGGK